MWNNICHHLIRNNLGRLQVVVIIIIIIIIIIALLSANSMEPMLKGALQEGSQIKLLKRGKLMVRSCTTGQSYGFEHGFESVSSLPLLKFIGKFIP